MSSRWRVTLPEVLARRAARNAAAMHRVAARLPVRSATQRDCPRNSGAATPARATAPTTSTDRTRLDGYC